MGKNSKNESTAFRSISLTYSSPTVCTLSTAPDFFYNAFPDLNDVAPDGSRSAFPRRAKYNLPLDSTFLPSARWVESNNIDGDYLASLDSIMHERILACFAVMDRVRHENPKLRLPRKPELNKVFRIEGLCEVPHKRLAATDYKLAFRTFLLASFYSSLENHLVRGQKIRVPLVASYRGSQLQRHLAAIDEIFKPTQLIDEAVALLVCVTLLPPEEAKALEQAWILEEKAEHSGFIDSYRMLRDEFNPESCTTAGDRSALAERIIKFAHWTLYASTAKNVHAAEKLYWDPEKNPHVFWPSLLGEEVNCGLPQLCVRLTHNFVREKVATRISIPEAMQWLMALFSFLNDENLKFPIKDATWGDYVGFFLESGEDIAYARITSIPTAYLQTLVHLGIKKPDGSELDVDAPADILISASICRYTILLESIRQQLCTGVGLRCPFWKGSGCCEFRSLLQRTYDVAKPWHPIWKHHWQEPPCLA